MSKIEVNTVAPQCGTTLTLGESGDTVTLGAGASQSGFGRTGTVDWQTGSIKTSTFTAANGEGYFANTSGGAFTMNLPAGSAGAIVSVVDYTNTFQTNALTVSPNGSEKIGGVAATQTLTTEGQSVTFVYVDGTEGWKNVQDSTSNVIGNPFIQATGGTITTCGNFKIHTFTGPGTFTVCSTAVCSTNNVVDYLVAAGGGSGGYCNYAGGGGAGGFRFYANTVINPQTGPGAPRNNYPSGTSITVTATGFPVTVGGGGARPGSGQGVNGSNSIFSTITSAGGGGGGGNTCAALSGGSGGGGAGGSPVPSPNRNGGAGNTPPVSPSQGMPGFGPPASIGAQGAGGGGAMVGGPGTTLNGGAGAGVTGFGTSGESSGGQYYFSGGGGGFKTPGSGGTGGLGGGGDGANNPNEGPGTANTGGGGGSASPGNGGSGIVIIRYKFQ